MFSWSRRSPNSVDTALHPLARAGVAEILVHKQSKRWIELVMNARYSLLTRWHW